MLTKLRSLCAHICFSRLLEATVDRAQKVAITDTLDSPVLENFYAKMYIGYLIVFERECLHLCLRESCHTIFFFSNQLDFAFSKTLLEYLSGVKTFARSWSVCLRLQWQSWLEGGINHIRESFVRTMLALLFINNKSSPFLYYHRAVSSTAVNIHLWFIPFLNTHTHRSIHTRGRIRKTS